MQAAKTAEKDAVAMLGEGADLSTVEMDALPVAYGKSFEPSEDLFPVQQWKDFFKDGDDTGMNYWAVRVNLPAGTEGFNPAYLTLNTVTYRLTPQFPTDDARYLVYTTKG